MKLYISDPHFFHEKLNTQLDNRGFVTVREMNAFMIEQWNKKVQGGDQVIVLGDLFKSRDADEVNYVLNRLNGKICLIEGNHDGEWLKREGVNLNRFEWIRPYAELKDGDFHVILSHYPTFCYNHQFLKRTNGEPRTYMLYGHVHNSHDEILVNQFQNLTRKTILKGATQDREIPCQMINCFCMFSNYQPLSLKEWIKVDEERRKTILIPEDQILKDELF